MKKIWIASDHAGFELKSNLLKKLTHYNVNDLGCFSLDSVDYPDYANKVCKSVENIDSNIGFGILICGSGQGMMMRANKFPWIRAALVWNKEIAKLAREHNNANVLCLGARFHTEVEILEFIEIFANTNFAEGRHSGRVAKLSTPI